MLTDDHDRRWTIVHNPGPGDGPVVRRYPVPGGWLYQVAIDEPSRIQQHWHAPMFVAFRFGANHNERPKSLG